MNDFGNYFHFGVSDSEVFLERFESAVVAAMAEAFNMKHVEGHSATRHLIFRGERKSCFWIDEALN